MSVITKILKEYFPKCQNSRFLIFHLLLLIFIKIIISQNRAGKKEEQKEDKKNNNSGAPPTRMEHRQAQDRTAYYGRAQACPGQPSRPAWTIGRPRTGRPTTEEDELRLPIYQPVPTRPPAHLHLGTL